MTSVCLISDFNIELFGRLLVGDKTAPACRVTVAPFNQVYQSLAMAPPEAAGVDVGLVWTRPEGVVGGFRRALAFEAIAVGDLLEEVDLFADGLLRHAQGVRHLFVASWCLPPGTRGYGMLDLRPGLGLADLLARMNLRLADRLAAAGNVFLLDAGRWLGAEGAKAAAPKMWYGGKVPYANGCFLSAVADVKAALAGLAGAARRIIILDLDNTLWGGVVGETGWQQVTLGGHSLEGEAYADFQAELKALANRGILLALASKNDEATALEVIDRHPEMRLRRSDLAGWRIDWNDKAANIASLMDELRLGLASAVFIDDNPAERGRVREALPDVLVPDWPEDPTRYATALRALRCFDTPSVNAEDRQRSRMYVAERERRTREPADSSGSWSPEAWLKTLDLRVAVRPLDAGTLPRAAQLFNKTNQMNLATRRLSEKELAAWAAGDGRVLWTFSVADRFGDSGLTGIVSVELDGKTARIVDFILSCRVMGRRIEEAMLHVAVAHARAQGACMVTAALVPTERNGPCHAFWEQVSAFIASGGGTFTWDAAQPYPLPSVIAITGPLLVDA